MDNKIVFMFSGQGAQYTGMGKELYDSSDAARAIFELADSIRPGTMRQCFSGSDEELGKTANTQPCVFCVDLAAAAALKEAGVNADILAGFSLGELPALAFSGAISYEDGFRLVCKRAEFMENASETTNAGMAAVLRLSNDDVERLCKEHKNVFPVNYNCPGQIVVAGLIEQLDLFKEQIAKAGGRYIPLKTSGGFHSPFMIAASADFAAEIISYNIEQPSIPTYSNVTGKPYDGEVKDLLARQISSPVKWESAVREMLSAGANTFIETGPGKTLCGLVQRISDNARILNVEDSNSLNITLREFSS